jgi:Ca-activated chloride channel family protein
MSNLPKPVKFGLFGAAGALAVALLLGELILWAGLPTPPKVVPAPPPPQQQVDVMFALDCTSSMQFAIDGTRDGIVSFAEALNRKDLDARIGLIGFRDRVWTKPKVDILFVLDVTSSMQFAIDGTRDGISSFADELSEMNLDARVGLIGFRDRMLKKPKVDLIFVLDITGSMQGEINGVRNGIEGFAKELDKAGLDMQIGLVAYRDVRAGEATRVLKFPSSVFTKNAKDFSRELKTLTANGGGDAPESSFDGLATASQQPFRQGASKILLLITDAPPRIPDTEMKSVDDVVKMLSKQGIDQLHLVVDPRDRSIYEKLQVNAKGKYFSLAAASRGTQKFEDVLPSVAGQIATTFGGGSAPKPGTGKTVAAKDVSPDPEILQFDGDTFTSDFAAFRREVSKLQAAGGGDIPESSLDALDLASRQSFRRDAQHVLVLITDAPPTIPDKEMESVDEVLKSLVDNDIHQLHMVVNSDDRPVYEPLHAGAKGLFFSLKDAAQGKQQFADILPRVAEQIATSFGDEGSSKTAKIDAADSEEAPLEPEILMFDGDAFTKNMKDFRREVGKLKAIGGGDIPESSLDALALAADQKFREKATQVLVLVTDAGPRIPDKETIDLDQLAARLGKDGPDQLHLVTLSEYEKIYNPLQKAVSGGGKFFSLADAVSGERGFDDMLPELGAEIAKAIPEKTVAGLQSGKRYVASQSGQLIFAMGLWTAVLALGIAVALVVGQNLSLHRSLMTSKQAMTVIPGSLATGLLAGAAGQYLFQLATTSEAGAAGSLLWDAVSRICALTFLGAALGTGLSFFIPNLDWKRAAAGAGVGGAIAALVFLASGAVAGELLGRQLGAATLGFAIGLLVALADVAFRSAWLEVAFGPGESSSITLGTEAVLVGSGSHCTVWVPGVAEVACRFRLHEGNILCEDGTSSSETQVAAGDTRQIGRITATVCTSATHGSKATPGMQIQKAPPPPPDFANPANKAASRPKPQRTAPPTAKKSVPRKQAAPKPAEVGTPKPPPPPPPKRPYRETATINLETPDAG